MRSSQLDLARPQQDRHHRPALAMHTAHPTRSLDTSTTRPAPPHPLLRLQQIHGNRHVQRLLQERRDRPTAPMIQCKLTVNQPGDAYEQEADAIAAAAVAPPAAAIAPSSSTPIARKASGGGSCPSAPSEDEAAQAQAQQEQEAPAGEEETAVMAKAIGPTLASLTRPAALEERLAQRKGTGAPLPAIARSQLEARLGHPFGDVRVHTDGEAADLTRSLAAEAFTTGSDLYFAPGRFDPDSTSGRRLLAHELVHVVQQRSDAQPQPAGGSTPIQRYGLVGFPQAEKDKMDAAIPLAMDTVEDCDDVGWIKTKAIKDTLRSTFYVYDSNLGGDEKLCGWTFPLSKVIKIGKAAFASGCCKLESTLAHEAAHVSFSTESGARELEKDCFGCS